jgi:hypothetical protein
VRSRKMMCLGLGGCLFLSVHVDGVQTYSSRDFLFVLAWSLCCPIRFCKDDWL